MCVYVCVYVCMLHLLSHTLYMYITTEHAPVYSGHGLRQPPASPGPRKYPHVRTYVLYVRTVCTAHQHIISYPYTHTCVRTYMQYVGVYRQGSSLQDGCWGHCGCVNLKQALLQYKMLPPQVDNVVLHGTSHWTVVIQASIP